MAAMFLVTAAALAGCSVSGGSSNVASHTPSPPAASPSPSTASSPTAHATPSQGPQPVSGAYGVLYGTQSAATYTVSLVGVDGKVVASADASTPVAISCANAAAALVSPPVSTSNSRAYFMDAQGVVRFLGPGGDTGRATSVPVGTASRRAMFAVSPDDQRIAVVVDDFTSNAATTHLYVEDLNGSGNHVDLFNQNGAFTLWPIGWHGTNNLVLAKVPSCTQGGGSFCCGPLELHVVDPATANRRFTLGTPPTCVIAGSPSPAGAVCEDTAGLNTTILSWTNGTIRTQKIGDISLAYLSPSGRRVAMVNNNGTFVYDGSIGNGTKDVVACGWLDDTHLLSGGDAQHQPRLADVTNWSMVPVAAQGDCAGRLPGGL